MSFDVLFREIQKLSEKSQWSRAVDIARRGHITILGSEGSSSRIFRVPELGVAHQVELFLDDPDWTCDCDSEDDPCLHVMASAICYRNQAELKLTPESARLEYHLFESNGHLGMRREIHKSNGERQLLDYSLSGAVSSSRPYQPSKLDVTIDAELRFTSAGILHATMADTLPKLLVDLPHLFYEGSQIKLHAQACGWRLSSVKFDRGYRVKLEQDPKALFWFSNGWVLYQDYLCAQQRLASLSEVVDVNSLRVGVILSDEAWLLFLSTKVPSIAKLVDVPQSLTAGLKMQPLNVSIDVASSVGGHSSLLFRSGLRYGDRYDIDQNNHMTSVDGSMAIRRLADEDKARDEFFAFFGLNLGESYELETARAIDVATRIAKWRGEVRGEAWKQFLLIGDLCFQWEDPAEEACFVSAGMETQPIKDVLACVDAGKNYLQKSGLLRIPKEWIEKYRSQLNGLIQDTHSSVHPLLKKHIRQQIFSEISGGAPNYEAFVGKILSVKNALPVTIRVDRTDVVLRPYQEVGINWMRELSQQGLGGILADDMGLGKTLQAILSIDVPALIVVPTTLLANWMREIRRFRPELSINRYHGSSRRWVHADIVLTTYGVLRSERSTFLSQEWKHLVMDEGQLIKNHDSLAYQALTAVKARSRIVLSGTPVENRAEDLWALMSLVNPYFLGGIEEFRQRYLRVSEDRRRIQLVKLAEYVAPFLMRRKKVEVASDLPPRTEVIIRVSGDDVESESYQRLAVSARAAIGDKNGALDILAWILKLRQHASDPSLINSEWQGLSAKMKVLMDRVGEAVQQGHKVLVFSQWTSLLDRIERRFQDAAISNLRIDGSRSAQQRASIVERFQEEGSEPVLIMSLKAGGVGLNLTAADHVFIVDPWWNPAAEDQAADRAHRIGQIRPVTIYKMITEGTIEEKIIELQQKKRDLMQTLVDGGDIDPANVDQLRELIQ
jgi:superfamily II DNA or RNA helicase